MIKKALLALCLAAAIIIAVLAASSPKSFEKTEVADKTEETPVTLQDSVQALTAEDTSQTAPAQSPITETNPAGIETRGVWIATVLNIDMPQRQDSTSFTLWAEEACENALRRNLNTIIFQVKPTADALYKSNLSPWSGYIKGDKQGIDPGFDPLEIMLNAAHSRGLELHAWINPYRVTMPGQTLEDLSENNVAVKNPSWVVSYGEQLYLNPGLPEVRQYLLSGVQEIVENYDVDAIHMDDYFYPYPSPDEKFADSEAYKKYGAEFSSVEDWRRNNVNVLVADIYKRIKISKPYVRFGISPFGVWRNASSDETGSNTRAGAENYDSLYADTRQWMKDGSVDYLVPQIYWSRISERANFSVLIDWWNEETLNYSKESHPINLYVGLADYKVASTNNDSAWEKSPTEISEQIVDIREKEAIKGQIHYNYSALIKNPLNYFDEVMSSNYKSIVLPEPMPWISSEQARPPLRADATSTNDGIQIKITPQHERSGARKYIIERADSAGEQKVIAVIYESDNNEYLDKTVQKGNRYVYIVSAVSEAGVQNLSAVSTEEVIY